MIGTGEKKSGRARGDRRKQYVQKEGECGADRTGVLYHTRVSVCECRLDG